MSATTYRAELAINPTAINRGQHIPMPGSLAGTSPYNPVHAGMGMQITVQGSSSIASVTAKMFWLLDETASTSTTVTLTKSLTQENTWIAQGSAGGPALGFPSDADYDIPKPFDLEVTILYRGGTKIIRRTIWIGSARHYTCSPCYTRTPFQMELRNCCYNGQGFRLTDYGVAGEYDRYFTAAEFPTWAIGMDTLTGGAIDLACSGADLINPYIPDSISGVVSDPPFPDDPFVYRTATVTATSVPFDLLGAAQRLKQAVQSDAANLGLGVSAAAAPPSDPDGNAFASPPGYQTLASAFRRAPAPPDSREATARRRGRLQAVWQASNPAPGLVLSLNRDVAGALQNPASISFVLSGFDSGEQVYLFSSVAYGSFSGEVNAAAPNDQTAFLAIDPLVLTRKIAPATVNGVPGAATSPLVSALGDSAASTPVLLSRAITGTAIWNNSAQQLGGVATIGTTGTLAFTAIADLTYLLLVNLKLQPSASFGPHAPALIGRVVLQGVVCRPNTNPYQDSGQPFGVSFPQGAYLTNAIELGFKD